MPRTSISLVCSTYWKSRYAYSTREGDAISSRAALEAAAAMYLVYYRNHLSTEERQAMPRAAQLLTQEDWAAIADAAPESSDPMFGEEVQARFATLRKQIAAETSLSTQQQCCA
ncbi:hypothetical protein ASL20_11155 [Cupriavidus necator]|nr:hypothetical protein ASL20_11155 [Cupriavidus necator]